MPVTDDDPKGQRGGGASRQSLRGSLTELIRVGIVERRNKFDNVNKLDILKYIYYLS
jgi:hypothetical protein